MTEGAQPVKEAPNQEKNNAFVVSLMLAGLVFAVFYFFLKDFVQSPLREVSSVVAEFLLKIFYVDVHRDGTILTLSQMKFNVVGACSGSTTLNVLTALGIFWAGTYPGLTFSRKVLAACLTVPIAIIANGLRVALLVAGSAALDEPIAEGPLHSAIGLVGFAVGMGGFFFITDRLTVKDIGNRKSLPDVYKALALSALLLLIYSPFIYACAISWIGAKWNPFESSGVFFFIGGVAAFVVSFRKAAFIPNIKAGHILAVLAVIVAIASNVLNVRFVLGLSLLATLSAFTLYRRGNQFAVCALPLFGIVFLGYPKISTILNTVTSIFGFSAYKAGGLAVRVGLAVALVVIYKALKAKMLKDEAEIATPATEVQTAKRSYPLNFLLAMAALTVCFQAYFSSAPMSGKTTKKFTLAFDLNPWVGFATQISRTSLDYFGRGNIFRRRYENGDRAVNIIVNSSGGDRSRNHPPEYCQTGAGWKIKNSTQKSYELPTGTTIETTRAEMTQNGREIVFVYWFTDGEVFIPDYFGMMLTDTTRRFWGKKTDWFLFRVIADNEEDMTDFVKHFDWSITDSEEDSGHTENEKE